MSSSSELLTSSHASSAQPRAILRPLLVRRRAFVILLAHEHPYYEKLFILAPLSFIFRPSQSSCSVCLCELGIWCTGSLAWELLSFCPCRSSCGFVDTFRHRSPPQTHSLTHIVLNTSRHNGKPTPLASKAGGVQWNLSLRCCSV